MKLHASRLLFGVELALCAAPPSFFLGLMGLMALTDEHAVRHPLMDALPFYVFLGSVAVFWLVALSFLMRGSKALRGRWANAGLLACALCAGLIGWGAWLAAAGGERPPIVMAAFALTMLLPISHLFIARAGARSHFKPISSLSGEDSGPVSI